MFPLEFPLRVLRRFEGTKARVLDPFCGRGTTNFAARMLGLRSVGFDVSDVAAAVAKSKLANSSLRAVQGLAAGILSSRKEPRERPSGAFWNLAYHPEVLDRICLLRERLAQEGE